MNYLINLKDIADELDFDVEDVEMIMNHFIEDSKSNLKQLKIAVESNDIEQIAQSSHAIKGSASNILLKDITSAAKDIEDNAREGNSTDYMEKYIKLEKLLQGLTDE